MSPTTTEYAGNYIYENGTLQFFSHSEGYVKFENGVFDYVYQYKDHLGNIRLSYSDASGNGIIEIAANTGGNYTEIVEESNYYPFGLKHRGYNNVTSSNGNSVAQRWGFTGKEHQNELNLGWIDITARNYNASLGRWMNLDPLSEKFVETSPYVYAKNNPIFFMDKDGNEPVPGPFSGHGKRNSNGTITVDRITAGQRYLVKIYYEISMAGTGLIGNAFGIHENIKTMSNSNENIHKRIQTGFLMGADGISSFMLTDAAAQGFGDPYRTASGRYVNEGRRIKDIFKGFKNAISAVGVADAISQDSSPSRFEFISERVFHIGNSFIPGGYTNISQSGLFDINDPNATVEGAESRLNSIYHAIDILLGTDNFDLSTEFGRFTANEYINDNKKFLAMLSQAIYRAYNNKTDEEQNE